MLTKYAEKAKVVLFIGAIVTACFVAANVTWGTGVVNWLGVSLAAFVTAVAL